MQRVQESENGDILEHITNQRLAESHYALSAESAGVRERLRRILLNWAVHLPVKGCLQEDDDERLVRESLDESAEKIDDYRTMREGTGEEVPKGMWEVREGKVGGRCPKKDGGRIMRGVLTKMSQKGR